MFSLMRLGNKSTKKKNDVKIKNEPFSHQINQKSKKSLAYNRIILDKFTKESL